MLLSRILKIHKKIEDIAVVCKSFQNNHTN